MVYLRRKTEERKWEMKDKREERKMIRTKRETKMSGKRG